MKDVVTLTKTHKAESKKALVLDDKCSNLSGVARSLFMQTGDIKYYLLYKELKEEDST